MAGQEDNPHHLNQRLYHAPITCNPCAVDRYAASITVMTASPSAPVITGAVLWMYYVFFYPNKNRRLQKHRSLLPYEWLWY